MPSEPGQGGGQPRGQKRGEKRFKWTKARRGDSSDSSDTVLKSNNQGDGEFVSQASATLRKRASPSCRERRQNEVAMDFSKL